MTTDDWNIKEKEISLDFNKRLLGDTVEKVIANFEAKEDEIVSVKVVPSKHLETLRQKLTEDIYEYNLRVLGDHRTWTTDEERDSIENIINKRFGVKQ